MPDVLGPRRAAVAVVVVVVATAGAMRSQRPVEVEQSGSRIKIINYTTTDGLIMASPNLFHDTQLDLDCAFQTASDGILRCLPTPSAYFYPSAYSDAACTLPVAFTAACTGGQPPKYAFQSTPQTCPATPDATVYTVGAPLTTIYTTSGASCVSQRPCR